MEYTIKKEKNIIHFYRAGKLMYSIGIKEALEKLNGGDLNG